SRASGYHRDRTAGDQREPRGGQAWVCTGRHRRSAPANANAEEGAGGRSDDDGGARCRRGAVPADVRVGSQAARSTGARSIAAAVPPEDGRANKALIELLCEVLHLRRSQVELLSGEKSRDKRLLIRGLGTHDLTARLAAFLE